MSGETTKEKGNDDADSCIINPLLSVLTPFGKKLSRQQRVAAAHMVLMHNVLLCGPRQCGKRWVANAFMRVMNNAQRPCMNVSLNGTEMKNNQIIMKEPYGSTLESHAGTVQTWILSSAGLALLDLQTWLTCFDFYLKIRRNSSDLFGGCQIIVIYDTSHALSPTDFPAFMVVNF